MAKKIYNKNAREAHLMAEAYERVYNEDGKREYDKRGFLKNTEAGKEDGNEPDNRNKGDTPWYDVKDTEDAEDNEDNKVEFPNSEYGRSLERDAKQHEQEDKEMRDDIERLQKLVADGYVRLHKDGEFQVLAPWQGSTSFPILKGQGWEEVPFPSIRLTLNEPGTASVHLRPPYTDIDKYLDKGYKVVDNYVKATQSEDNEYGYRETRPDTPPDREYQEEDPRAGEPEYDEERSERFRDDGPEDRKAPVSTKSIENQDETKRRMKQLGWEDNETRAQKAKRRREEKQRYNLHGNVLKHVKGPHDIYKK